MLMVATGCVRRVGGAIDQHGLASWYGQELAGRKTASGERYNPQGFTAAHRRLAFGTCVEVTLERNQRSTQVRVNDRGPFVSGRIVDLSSAAARAIDLRGVENVTLSQCR